ncbi:MAG: non-ribosomal peptide synthetase [Bacillota bacterium]|nr:non-ribosomal peptide synthetase [Bacillota bacterium]
MNNVFSETLTASKANYNFKSISELFEKSVEEHASLPCIETGNLIYSYEEVNKRANQLASFIRKSGAGPETLIGVFLERSPELIISILAILKSGSAYVPIDPKYASERVDYILNNTNLNMILSTSNLQAKISIDNLDKELNFILIDELNDEIEKESVKNLPFHNAANDLAYIIYTSGSTGKPKGVMIEHKGIQNLVSEQIIKFKLNKNDRVLQFASIGFDASVSEIFTTLVAGAALVLLPQNGLHIGKDLYKILQEKQISVATIPPSVLNTLPSNELPDLKTLVSAGEACTRKLIDNWSTKLNFINAYGPTEATVCATMNTLDSSNSHISIGKPISNVATYILDNTLNPVAPGEKGELYISSIGLARGYINAPELTEERFISNPFKDSFSNRLYKTGDICRWISDNELEWLERADFQVKISGMRIELGEIETVLNDHPNINQAVVIATKDEDGNFKLDAYVKADSDCKPRISELKNYLRLKLPDYMIPSRFMFLDSFPTSTSGKVDRTKLPAFDDVRPDIDTEYVGPRSDLEKALAEIWKEVLNIDKVGVYDNFFELGGQSLMATKMVSRIRSSLNMDVPISIIFNITPTIEQTALALENYQLEQLNSSELEELLSELEDMDEAELQLLLSQDN